MTRMMNNDILYKEECYKIIGACMDFGFRYQIQRASVSIMSNIAEGFESGSKMSFIQFLTYSYRSASEVESLLFVALDIHYIDANQHNELISQLNSIKKLTGGFISYLKNSQHSN